MEPDRRRRVMINADANNEADDQFAIVHAVLSGIPDEQTPLDSEGAQH